MQIVADTHIHFYPCYHLDFALKTLTQNLKKLSPDAVKMAFFVERSDCHFFSELCKDEGRILKSGFEISRGNQKDVIIILKQDEACLYLFPGRQIVTSERIEILSLTSDKNIDDGLPVDTVIKRILDASGVPVISWAPGKWFFHRGKVIEKLLDRMSPRQLLIGDTSLRPTLWKKPLLMQSTEKAGFKTLAGSDPLPFPGEEVHLGTYGSSIKGVFKSEEPVKSIRSLLTDPDIKIESIGRRNSSVEALRRLLKNARTKQRFD